MNVIEKEHSIIIYRTSFLSIISALYAYKRRHYDLICVPGGVFITSIIYWSNPIRNNWRRKLDMSYVFCALVYQLIRTYKSKYSIQYYILISISILCYFVGVNMDKRDMKWGATYMHCLLHIIANIGNILLYSDDL